MPYRWLNVDVTVADDGTVDVGVEGRGAVLPFTEHHDLAPGEKLRVHYLVEMDGRIDNEDYYTSSRTVGDD